MADERRQSAPFSAAASQSASRPLLLLVPLAGQAAAVSPQLELLADALRDLTEAISPDPFGPAQWRNFLARLLLLRTPSRGDPRSVGLPAAQQHRAMSGDACGRARSQCEPPASCGCLEADHRHAPRGDTGESAGRDAPRDRHDQHDRRRAKRRKGESARPFRMSHPRRRTTSGMAGTH